MWFLRKKGQSGQTTAEYAIIVALIAVCSIACIMCFGNQIRNLFGAESQTMAGNNTPVTNAGVQTNSTAHWTGSFSSGSGSS